MRLPEGIRIALGEVGIGPRWDGDRCNVCDWPLRSVHRHGGVRVLPRPLGPPPPPPPPPPVRFRSYRGEE